MKLGYLVNTYPRASHTFIRREIHALERAGWHVQRFAMRSDRAALTDPADLAEDDRTEHLLAAGAIRLGLSALGLALRRPGAVFGAFRMAMACGARGAGGGPGTGGRLRHLIYLVEAAHLARRCSALGIGHLHAHFGTNSTTVAMLCHRLGGPRYSFTTHGPEEFDAPHALSLGAKLSNAAFAVAISSFGRSQLCRWVAPAHWPKIHIIHCGIEADRLPPPVLHPANGPNLVAVGRLSGQKGFALLIDAIAMAAPGLPGLQLTLVGDGELRGQIESTIARHGLGRRITLAGWQSETGVRSAIEMATALILPSFAEGLPMVVMEAMALQRPVIATAIAGVPELVTPETGWLVPAGDATALARAIKTLAETPAEQLVAMGRAGRDRVLSRHDIDAEAARLSTLFKALPT